MENLDSHKITAFNCPNCGAAAAVNSHACAYCGSSLYTRVCAACFSAVSINMNHCPQCGASVAESQRGAEIKNNIKCPACDSTLEIQAGYDHPLYACPQCGGLWMDHDSFQLVCDRIERQTLEQGYKFPDAKAAVAEKSRRAYIRCPECGVIMTPKNFAKCSGIIIDCCRKHGNWFDWQELHQVAAFIQKGGMSKSRKLELDRAVEDARRERDSRNFGSALKRFISDPSIKAPKD